MIPPLKNDLQLYNVEGLIFIEDQGSFSSQLMPFYFIQ